MRIFSLGACLRRVTALTLRTNDLISLLHLSAPSLLLGSDWDTPAPAVVTLPPVQELTPPLNLSGALSLSSVPLSLTVYG